MDRKIAFIVSFWLGVNVLSSTTFAFIPTEVLIPPSPKISACVRGGCSSQLCVDANLDPPITTCEWREEYACLNQATCERQADGQCGWTYTPSYQACIGGMIPPKPTFTPITPNPPPEPSLTNSPLLAPTTSPSPLTPQITLLPKPTLTYQTPTPQITNTLIKPYHKPLPRPRTPLLLSLYTYIRSLFKH